VKENAEVALAYKGKSVAEQNSVDVAWDLLKATIVIEHLIQASDVAHTMQHWHIYRKWNERLFLEMLKAYREGHAEKDPTDFWYEGEIGFFDYYIIPLAKKLKDCGVFGVSSDEYLNYAQKNRQEWEARGQEVVAAMVEKYQAESAPPAASLDAIQVSEPSRLRAHMGRDDSSSDCSDVLDMVEQAEALDAALDDEMSDKDSDSEKVA
jgi:hypothetical protein